MKAFKTVISVILTIVATVCIIGFLFLKTSNKIILNETKGGTNGSTSIITSLDKDLFGIDVTKYKKYENVDTVTPEMVHEVVDGALIKKGYPPKVVDYILKEDNYQEMYTTYKNEIFGYLKGEIEKPKFPEDRLNGMIDRGLRKYNEENANKINVEKAILDFNGEVSVLTDSLNNKIEKIKGIPGVTKLINVLTNSTLRTILLIGAIVSIVLLLVINKVFVGLIYTGVSFILSGIGLLCATVITKLDALSKVKDTFINSFNLFEGELTTKGIICIVGGALIIIGAIVLKIVVSKKKPEVKEEE